MRKTWVTAIYTRKGTICSISPRFLQCPKEIKVSTELIEDLRKNSHNHAYWFDLGCILAVLKYTDEPVFAKTISSTEM